MRTIIITVLLISSLQTFAQQLEFTEIGSDPAYCRLFGYQSGNGVVWAAATGGAPDYTYQLTNLQSGVVVGGSTWGGLNPGEYEVKVWDSVGDSISQIVIVDSLNPHAEIGVLSGYDAYSGNDFYNMGSSTYTFANHSQHFINQWNPNGDTTFFWQFTQYDSWQIRHTIHPIEQYSYDFGGLWVVKLVAVNKNGCMDTAQVHIHMFGAPLDIEDAEAETAYTLISNTSQNTLTINRNSNEDGEILKVYDLSGKVILKEELFNSSTSIPFYKDGIFLFEIINREKGALVQSGKFNF